MVVYFARLGLGSFSLSGKIVNSMPKAGGFCWIAVKELLSSYYIEETISNTIYTHYVNLIYVP